MSALYLPFAMVGRARGQIWLHTPQYRRPRHFHAELEMNIVTAGDAVCVIGTEFLRVTAGDLLSVPPGVEHGVIEASADFELYAVGMTAEFSTRVLSPTNAWAYGGPIRLRLPPDLVAQLRTQCSSAPTEAGDAGTAETRVGDLWRQIQAVRAAATSKSSAVTRRAVVSLQASPELGRDGLAKLARSHPTELSRLFHRDVGLTLAAYRNRVRILRFIDCVDRGSPLLSSALGAGFGSYSQCFRAFHGLLGTTPRRFFQSEVREQTEALYCLRRGSPSGA